MIIKSRCIVLHRFAYSDSSWIVKVLTEECGVVSFIVKGGKRRESPFKGAMDPLSLCEVVFNHNPQKADGGDLQFIKEATLLDWFQELRSDLMHLAVAQVMAEIVLRYAPQGVPLQDEFLLLQQAFVDLNRRREENRHEQADSDCHTEALRNQADKSRGVPANEVFARWLLDTCDLWGYHLDLDVCCRCERPLEEPAADFHPESGGLICKACLGVEAPRAKRETLLGLWKLRGGSFTATDSAAREQTDRSADLIKTEGFAREFVENALLAYLRNHIGFLRELKSLQFLSEARKLYG